MTVGQSRTQAIDFAAPADTKLGQPDRDLAASATSGLPVSFTSTTPDVCTIVDGAVHAVSPGDCTVNADQPGDDVYLAAPQVTRTFTVSAAAVVPVVGSVAVDVAPSSIAADGTSTATVTASVKDTTGDPLPGQTVTFTSSDANNTFAAITDVGDGAYTTTVTSSTMVHDATITAADGSQSGSAILTQTSVAQSPSGTPSSSPSSSTAAPSATSATPSSSSNTASGLADTGVQTSSLIALAFGFLLAGMILLAVERRRVYARRH